MWKFILTHHAKRRMRERGISLPQVRKVVDDSLRIKKQKDDKIEVVGRLDGGRLLCVVYEKLGDRIIIVTTFYGS